MKPPGGNGWLLWHAPGAHEVVILNPLADFIHAGRAAAGNAGGNLYRIVLFHGQKFRESGATMAAGNPFVTAQRQLDQCAQLLNLDAGILAVLRTPLREFRAALPVRMDDGSLSVFTAFRVQYNDARGPATGGIRFHPEITIDSMRALAAWMTWKCALLDLPLGGAMGGVVCNPKEMSQGELERLSRAYIDRLYPLIGRERDIPSPDVYTNPQIMAWMMDEYAKLAGKAEFGCITGKPLSLGGSAGRGDATARGGLAAVREAAGVCGLDLSQATVAIQGYGNAGYHAACLLTALFGARIVAISDSRGAVYAAAGIDPEQIGLHKMRTSSVIDFPGTELLPPADILTLDVDILVPAALEHVITEDNAPRVRARIVAELANGPTTPEAADILHRNGVHVIPDFLCNAGGVIVSYFEMTQNFFTYFWTEADVHARLDQRMTEAYHAVLAATRRYDINTQQAAHVVAVERVAEAMRLRGWM